MGEKIGAIVLAGGRGSRMKSSLPKQYMTLLVYPIIYYALKAFEDKMLMKLFLLPVSMMLTTAVIRL